MSTPTVPPPGAPPGDGVSELKGTVEVVLHAIRDLMELHRAERMMHLVLSVFAVLLLLYGVGRLLVTETVTTELLVTLFGPSGLLAAASMRLTHFFNKAFRLLETVTTLLLQRKVSDGRI